jgi:hypothetical protein
MISSILFAGCSRRFEQLDPKPHAIDLTPVQLSISQDAARTFIDFCQMQPFEVTGDTFVGLDALADYWEVDDLKAELSRFLRDHSIDELTMQLLERAIARGSETRELIAVIHDNFKRFMRYDRLLRLPLSIMNRVMNYDVQNEYFEEFFEFLKKCVTVYGSSGSVLLRRLDLSRLTFDDIQFISDRADFFWTFAGSSISSVISGLANEVLKQKLLGDVSTATLANDVSDLRVSVRRSEMAQVTAERRISEQLELLSERVREEGREIRSRLAAVEGKLEALSRRLDAEAAARG